MGDRGTAEPPRRRQAEARRGGAEARRHGGSRRSAAEWKQMYHEVWRIERDFFYDPRYHGLDLAKVEQKYEPYLDGLAPRDDLNYLFEECSAS